MPGRDTLSFCCHVLHIPMFCCSPAMNNAKSRRGKIQKHAVERETGRETLPWAAEVEKKDVSCARGGKATKATWVQAENIFGSNAVRSR